MQTLKIELSDDVYEDLKSSNIDFQTKIKEYIATLLYDDYPAIFTDEAKKRVSDAVDRYKNGTGVYLDSDEYCKHKSEIINSLKSKYANN